MIYWFWLSPPLHYWGESLGAPLEWSFPFCSRPWVSNSKGPKPVVMTRTVVPWRPVFFLSISPLVTFLRKTVNFRHIIIHVTSIGCSHFNNNCHVFLISCHAILVLYLVAAQAIYQFAPCLRGIHSFVKFCDALHTCKLRAAKNGEWVGPTNQLQRTSILNSLDLRPFWTSKNCFSQTFECSLLS